MVLEEGINLIVEFFFIGLFYPFIAENWSIFNVKLLMIHPRSKSKFPLKFQATRIIALRDGANKGELFSSDCL